MHNPLANIIGNTISNTSSTDGSNVSNRPQAPSFPRKQSISFLDIENLIPSPFSGSKSDNVLTWLARFEALAESFEFSEMQKFILVERALKGIALLFVQSEPNLTSYAALKKALLVEFGHASSPAQIHQQLAIRYRRSNESLLQYFLHMRDMANLGKINDVLLIHYIIYRVLTTFHKIKLYFLDALI